MPLYEMFLKITFEADNDDDAQHLAETTAEQVDEFLEAERGDETTEIQMVQEVKP